MRAFLNRFSRTASGELLWINLALALGVKALLPLAGIGLATIGMTLGTVDPDGVVAFTNQARAAVSAPPLLRDARLEDAAARKLADMQAKGYFAHQTPAGLQPWDFINAAGYGYQSAGENLGKGFSEAETLVTAWMGSPAHRANLLNPAYRNIGVAVGPVAVGGRTSVVVVQMFGAPSAAAARPAATPHAAAAPAPPVQRVSTDARVAGVEVTEVAPAAEPAVSRAAGISAGVVGGYLVGVLLLVSAGIAVHGVRRHSVTAWIGSAFALLLLMVVPTVRTAVGTIF